MERYTSCVSPFLLKYNSISKNAIPASLLNSQNAFKQQQQKQLHRLASSNKHDYYEVLGLSQSCSEGDIKKAYKKLARMYHPDVNHSPDSVELFKKIRDAYEILSDTEQRRKYDMQRSLFKVRDVFVVAQASSSSSSPQSPIFAARCQHQHHPSSPPTATSNDIFHTVYVSLEELYAGKRKKFQVSRLVMCKECSGKGLMRGVMSSTCSHCEGKGLISRFQGMLRKQLVCTNCQGTGLDKASTCEGCNGGKRVLEKSSVRVDIPPGLQPGTQITLKGQGDENVDQFLAVVKRGDLVFTIEQKPHDQFLRMEQHLLMRHELTLAEVMSGTCLIGHLDGRILRCLYQLNDPAPLPAPQPAPSASPSLLPLSPSSPQLSLSSSPTLTPPVPFSLIPPLSSSPQTLFSPCSMPTAASPPSPSTPLSKLMRTVPSLPSSMPRRRVFKCAKNFGMPLYPVQEGKDAAAAAGRFGHLYIRFDYPAHLQSSNLSRLADLVPAHVFIHPSLSTTSAPTSQQQISVPLQDVHDVSAFPRVWVE